MKRDLKVLMIISHLDYTIRGGGSRHTYELCKALDKLGCQVYVSCLNKPENKLTGIKRMIYVPYCPISVLDLASFNINMLRKTRGCEVNVIHSQSADGFIFGFIKKKPFVVTIHGSVKTVMSVASKYRHHISPYFKLLIEKYALTKADKVIAVSELVANLVKASYEVDEEKVVFIPNGVDVEKFNPQLDTEAIRNKYSVSGPLLLCVTRLSPDRRVIELVSAIEKVAKEIPDVKVIVVGDGPLRQTLERLRDQRGLTERLVFTGAKNDDELPYFYAAADLCILPIAYPAATKELTVLEAMASGKVTVYIDRVGVTFNELKIDNPIGVNSDKDFVSTITYLLQNEKKRKVLGLAGRKMVTEELSWDKVAQKTIEVYKSLV